MRTNAIVSALSAAMLITLSGCAGTAGEGDAAARLEKALPGVYEGVIPCADCAGIRTALFVKATGTYTRVSQYLGSDGAFEDAGSWHVEAQGPAADAAGGAAVVFEPISSADGAWTARIEPNGRLRLLDRAGEPIEGPTAERYVLIRP